MTYLEFRQWVADDINRTNVTATSAHLHRWIRTARRDIQRRYSFKDMEEIYEVALIQNQESIGTPTGFKSEKTIRITDQSTGEPIIILDKEPDRAQFRRLVAVSEAQAILRIYKSVIVLFDTTGIEGYPLLYNIWRNQIDIFPKVGSQAEARTFSMDFYQYRQFDLSTLPAGSGGGQIDGFEDFLLDEYAELTFYRTMMEAVKWLREEERLPIQERYFQDAIASSINVDIDKDVEGTRTVYMGQRS